MSDRVALITKLYGALANRDVDGVLAVVDPSITIWQTEQLPWGGHYEGTDGMLEFFGKLLGSIASAVEIERIYEAGDHVVQIGRTRGTVNATGVEFDVAEAHIWEVRGGKAVSMRAYIDTPAMLAALDSRAPG
jgi:ketosteroid isomerase-like protein